MKVYKKKKKKSQLKKEKSHKMAKPWHPGEELLICVSSSTALRFKTDLFSYVSGYKYVGSVCIYENVC